MSMAEHRHFVLDRLQSLLGILPVGGYLLFHFFENASARNGPEAFNETVLQIGKMPYLYVLELLVVILPILFHGIFGLYLTLDMRPNMKNYPYGRNWAYFMQRITGIVAFLYIIYHAVTTRGWALFVKGSEYTYSDMQASLSSPLVLAFYIIGIVAVTWHFTNGLWGFSITWGILRTRKAQDQFALLTLFLFFVLAAVGLDILSAFVLKQSAFSLLGGQLYSFFSGGAI